MPYLMRGATLKTLMRSYVVVPVLEDAQCLVEGITIIDDQPIKLVFQGAEEAFDATVLPWLCSSVRWCRTPNAHRTKRKIGLQKTASLSIRTALGLPWRSIALRRARSIVMEVLSSSAWQAREVASASQFSASLKDVVLMVADEIADEGLADGVTVEAGVAAIEEIGEFAASGFKEARRVIQNFFPYPIRFSTVTREWSVESVRARRSKAVSCWRTSEPISCLQEKPSETGCEKRPQMSEDRADHGHLSCRATNALPDAAAKV